MGKCRSTSIPPLINPNTNEISVGEKEKADLLNSYFCNISTSSDDGVTPPDLPLRTQHSLDIDEITEDEIKDILKSLEIGKASGEDCISHQMLKYTANSFYMSGISAETNLANAESANRDDPGPSIPRTTIEPVRIKSSATTPTTSTRVATPLSVTPILLGLVMVMIQNQMVQEGNSKYKYISR
ncbi:unnamed protein product [Mytilus edulis]|uniref:Uncharacterized protein n=1 Tax=Mytilus edulis TaxID=6550 RepID=A0A8S3Q8J7_MYTED|nr:unnamed protein product [Mytilus edulis]